MDFVDGSEINCVEAIYTVVAAWREAQCTSRILLFQPLYDAFRAHWRFSACTVGHFHLPNMNAVRISLRLGDSPPAG